MGVTVKVSSCGKSDKWIKMNHNIRLKKTALQMDEIVSFYQ